MALCVVTTADGSPREFPHHDDAVHYAEHTILSDSNAVDYQTVAGQKAGGWGTPKSQR